MPTLRKKNSYQYAGGEGAGVSAEDFVDPSNF